MNKKIFMLFITLGIIVVGGYVLLRKTTGINSLPEISSRGGSGNVSSEYLNAKKAADHYREEIQKNPEKIKNYIEFAQVLLQEGRVTGNNGEYIPKAEYLLQEVLKRDPNNFDAIITQASIQATLHQFARAKELSEKALAINPHSAYAYGVLCDANVELGRYDEAVKVCDKMQSIRPDLRSYARASYLRELHGDVNGAIEAMKLAADAGISGQENRAWVLYNLGMLYANENNLQTAEYIFNGILEERPDYSHALSGLAYVRAMQSRHQDAVEFYRKAIASLEEPAFYESLGDVYAAMCNVVESENAYDKAEVLYKKETENGEENAMEMARFLAAHNRRLPAALSLARGAVERRPSVHSYETLALTLFKNNMYTEAFEAMKNAMKLGTRDASMYYLAGFIADRMEDSASARSYFHTAVSINPNYSLHYVADAKSIINRYSVAG